MDGERGRGKQKVAERINKSRWEEGDESMNEESR